MFDLPTSDGADINVIPPEILSQIFVHCLPVDVIFEPHIFTPQVLSSVCRLWHELVLATPALWASLDIRCSIDVLHPPLPVIGVYLQRSGAHPLSFILRDATRYHHPNADLNLLTVLTTLTTARQRWRDVRIRLFRMTQAILDLITLGDAPLLQSLRCEVLVPEETIPIPLRMVHGCPRLESFEWRDFRSPLLPPLRNMPLTSLRLGVNLTISECVNVLSLSPRLSSAWFDSVSSNPSPVPHLTHPTLCTLTAAGGHSTMLLTALTLPALLKLDLKPRHGMTPLPTEWEIILSAFLQRSNPTLHELPSMSHMSEPALLRILALTPHLRVLSLLGCCPLPALTSAIIRALHPSPPDVPMCPRLQELKLRASDCVDGLCGRMLRARWGADADANGVACLKHAYVHFYSGLHSHDRAGIRKLRSEGMDVTCGGFWNEHRAPGRE